MTPSHFIRRTLAAGLLLAGAACASSRRPSLPPGVGVMGDEAAKIRARADSARWPWTAGDVEFMSTMIAHHAQAIEMSKWAPTHGASPAVIRLTERIINAQSDEIKMMSGWLKDRNQPVPEPNAKGHVMQMNGQTHTMLMPGMLTDEQMKQLDAARGEQFDYYFLNFMIQHHRGAISMVEQLLSKRGSANDETVFKFAADVNTDQTTEVNRMLQMLLGTTPPQ